MHQLISAPQRKCISLNSKLGSLIPLIWVSSEEIQGSRGPILQDRFIFCQKDIK
jgi:hypothetical protein